jgi:uncharacterized protein
MKKMVEKRKDKDYYIRGTFTKYNKDFSEDIMEYYNLGFKKVSMEPVVASPKEDYALMEEDLEEVLREYEKFSKEYIDIKKKDKDFMFFHFMIDLNQGPCIIKRTVGCGAGSEYMAVTPEGDLYPCHQFVGNEDFILGNVDKGVVRNDITDEFKNCNVYSKKECSDCFARFYCSGGCAANAYNFNNKIDSVYEVGCKIQQKRIECALMIKAALADDQG